MAESGTLTFLFTDIVGHSSLWDTAAEEMSAALRDHDAFVEQTVAASDGTVVKNTGDGVMVTFADADRAVEAAVTLQRHFSRHEWPGIGRLHIRAGLHTGVADVRDGDFFGPDVIRASRLCHAGHGGQVLASRAVVELAPRHQWLDLGTHRLDGLREPVEIHQVVADGLAAEFPALRTASAHADDLPRFRTAFFGRGHEIEELAELLHAHRLVTLTGVGGSGKTRLAVAAAREVVDDFSDGAYFVDLSAVTDPERIWDAVASALALASSMVDASDTTRRDAVVRYLAGRAALLVLDNCEHLLEAAADVVDALLDDTSRVVVLATSREGLHVEGEHLVQVPSLDVGTDAVALLRDRVRAAGSDVIDDDLAVEICERLDGLPLAIELVAARCGQLGAAEVAQRLSDRFRLVTGSRRRVSRQRTLEATLDWSHDLLDDVEQAALRRLSVFAGGGTLEGIEVVTGADSDVVASLVDKSLLQRSERRRFHMLDTVRAYAEDRLVEAGEADATRQALAEWLGSTLETKPLVDIHLWTSGLEGFIADELPNLYASMDWAADRGDWDLVVRLGAPVALSAWEAADDTLRPVVAHLRQCLDAGIEGTSRHIALTTEALIAWVSPPDQKQRKKRLAETAASCWERKDPLSVVGLCWVANMSDAFGRITSDEALLGEAIRLVDRAEDIASSANRSVQSVPAYTRAILTMNRSEWERAADLFDHARRLSDRGPRFFYWFSHGAARLAAGRPFDRRDADTDQWRRLGPHLPGGIDVLVDAVCAHDPARPRQVVRLDRHDLDRFQAVPSEVSNLLCAVAQLASREDDWETASRLLAIARQRGGIFASPAGVALYRITVEAVRNALDKPRRDALLAEARGLDLATGLDLAVEWLARKPRTPERN